MPWHKTLRGDRNVPGGRRLSCAQGQHPNSETPGERADPYRRLEDIEKRLERLKVRFAPTNHQSSGALTPETRAVLSREVEYLQKEVQHLKAELASIKQQRLSGSSVLPSAPGPFMRSQTLKGLTITLANGQGRFTRGENRFCVEFRNVGEASMADVADVRVDLNLDRGTHRGDPCRRHGGSD